MMAYVNEGVVNLIYSFKVIEADDIYIYIFISPSWQQ